MGACGQSGTSEAWRGRSEAMPESGRRRAIDESSRGALVAKVPSAEVRAFDHAAAVDRMKLARLRAVLRCAGWGSLVPGPMLRPA